jgi:hypothetical protein
LVQIALASSGAGGSFGPAQSRQEQRRQNRNDSDHHQQFEQGKSGAWSSGRFAAGLTIRWS